MNLVDCLLEAQATASRTGFTIAVVHAPLENSEDEDGPYGFCPSSAVPILFRHGRVEQVIQPDPALSKPG